ncbi:MAG: MAE_28990/MAE_18760 family HEPN-like nuclease [Solidesulfovibrio sp.]|uniref:MAE_28990/MAE_18760 family HEPN-like nuclease n=1 Tax=Solidesulfovibrio sp. TaxID=2910990 RepID=UPI003158B0F1
MFRPTRSTLVDRMNESRRILSLIKSMENPSPLGREGQEVWTLRGLYFVNLYSIVEFTVRSVVHVSLVFISDRSVCFNCLKNNFYSIALDSEFKRCKDVNEKKGLEKRIELLEKTQSTDIRAIDPNLIHMYLQNIDYDRIKLIFKCFCIDENFSSVSRQMLYLNEIKTKRNDVSHGNESAAVYGKMTRSDELEKRFEAVAVVTDFIVSKFETSLYELSFLKEERRSLYLA